MNWQEISHESTIMTFKLYSNLLKLEVIRIILALKLTHQKFVTEEVIPRPAAERLVNIYDHGKQADLQFRADPFIKRTAGLSAPIKKARLPSFSSFKKCESDKGTPLSISAKQVSTSHNALK